MCLSLKRFFAALSFLAVAVLVLSGCASEKSAPSYAGSAKVDCGGKQMLKASGSTAQANAMTRFIKAYEKACPGHTLGYTSNGSGAGVSEFLSGQIDFGASDAPLVGDDYSAATERCGSDVWNLPVVFSPLAITYHLYDKDTLVLDASTLAKIFNGSITRWDDPAIKARNESMPSEPITVVFRNDASDTTDSFQRYLDNASNGAWGKGTGKMFNGGVGKGAPGNEGTSAKVRNTEGAITYNEWSFAWAEWLSAAKIVTSAGPRPVAINADTVGRAIAGATIVGQGNNLALDITSFHKPAQSGAYPIVLATYELVCSKISDPQNAAAVRAFLQSTVGPGQADLEDYGYFPLPSRFQSKVLGAVNAISAEASYPSSHPTRGVLLHNSPQHQSPGS
jgi:phosphate transport system substrate-binding protein